MTPHGVCVFGLWRFDWANVSSLVPSLHLSASTHTHTHVITRCVSAVLLCVIRFLSRKGAKAQINFLLINLTRINSQSGTHSVTVCVLGLMVLMFSFNCFPFRGNPLVNVQLSVFAVSDLRDTIAHQFLIDNFCSLRSRSHPGGGWGLASCLASC